MRKRILSTMLALVLLLGLAAAPMPVLSTQAEAAPSASGQAIVNKAKEYLGKVPYVYGGKTIDGSNPGADCSGFICRIYEKFGFNLWSHRTQLRKCGTNLGTDLSKAQLGDIIWFDGHVALYAGKKDGNHMIVHETGGSFQNVVYTKVSVVRAELKGIIRIPGVYNDVYSLTMKHNTNGGTIRSDTYTQSSSGMVQKNGADVTLKWDEGTGSENGLYNATTFGMTRSGYTFLGWSLSKDGSSTVFDQDDSSLKAETIYPNVKNGSATVTLYAIWKRDNVDLHFYLNYSGRNYLYDSDFTSLDSSNWFTRDASMVTLSTDSENTHDGYNSLKITSYGAGSSGKDLGIRTMTQGSAVHEGYVGDSKDMVLSFWARSSEPGMEINFRWGYESLNDYRSVVIATDWRHYAVAMDKTTTYNNYIHPYISSAGTIWIAEVQLEDGSTPTSFVPENGGLLTSFTLDPSGQCATPSAPSRSGYEFDGWYTSAGGGSQITRSSPARDGNFAVYAHWTELEEPEPEPEPVHVHELSYVSAQEPTCTESGHEEYWECEDCGLLFSDEDGENETSLSALSVPALGHDFEDGVCTRCGMDDPDYTEPEPGRDNPFVDVYDSDYYCTPVLWAYYAQPQITDGMDDTHFGPNRTVTRGQAVTFLWRSMGKPAPRSSYCPFTDVSTSDYYYQPVLWALERGITNGTSAKTFSPDATLTRGHIVTFLWRTTGRPDATGAGLWYDDAVNWARTEGLLDGTGTAFSPTANCPRSDVVTYLYRADQEGDLNPAEPVYDFVLDNCTWTQAFQRAKNAGGQLVRIETAAEYDAIRDEIAQRGLEYVMFRVGARRNENSADFYWVDGNNKFTGRPLNRTLENIGAQWAAGEPSLEWNGTQEDVLEFEYSAGMWVWNDIADQPNLAPGYCYGYIIEY